METRYTVHEVRGVAMGGGMFQVMDGYHGQRVGEPKYWRAEAEKIADRLNLANALPNTDDDGMPCDTYGNMKKWIISFCCPDGTEERREFWAATGDDCYRAIRAECKCCVAGYQRT